MDGARIRALIDYFVPREIVGPVVIVFSLENVVNAIFEATIPPHAAFAGWLAIFLSSLLLVAIWGATDESDNDELDDILNDE